MLPAAPPNLGAPVGGAVCCPRPVIAMSQEIDKRLLEILACPDCLGAVHQDGEWIVCEKCGRRYPIRDGLPIMLVEESLAPDEQQAQGEDPAE